ncbi:hypothetical protein [Actinophytocola sp.]|uniref:hypothetical protein n=1 Tax=Actinophytocola sp. TaxID=1872138 RepID=UPI003899EE49
MAADYDTRSISPVWQRHRAARTVAGRARDVKDLAELLGMLGLTAAEGRVPPAESPDEPPGPARRTPLVTLDPMSACRLRNLLRDGKAHRTGRSATPR